MHGREHLQMMDEVLVVVVVGVKGVVVSDPLL